jgi:palmitoyl-protein thioesterase
LINNEIADSRNETFAHNLSALEKLVLIVFDEDRTVVPKESAWFGSEVVPEDDPEPDVFMGQTPLRSAEEKPIIPIHEHPLYTEDWIGLRALDERGAVVFETCNGEHMHIGSCWEDIVRNFTGSLE